MFEKIKFIIATKLCFRRSHKAAPKEVSNDSRPVRVVKRSIKVTVIAFALLFIFGLFLYYFTPPTINVVDSHQMVIHTDKPLYMIKGSLNSGSKSTLKINDQDVELIGNDFTFETNLAEGKNKFVFEASSNRGTTREIHVVNLTTQTTP